MPAQQYTQEFITSVVVGKDVVPRIGLRQMESLRADLINAIKRSVDPKVREISIFVPLFSYTFLLPECLCENIPQSVPTASVWKDCQFHFPIVRDLLIIVARDEIALFFLALEYRER